MVSLPKPRTHTCGCFARCRLNTKFVAVADDGLPAVFKQCFELGQILQYDGDADLPAAHGGKELVEFIRQGDAR